VALGIGEASPCCSGDASLGGGGQEAISAGRVIFAGRISRRIRFLLLVPLLLACTGAALAALSRTGIGGLGGSLQVRGGSHQADPSARVATIGLSSEESMVSSRNDGDEEVAESEGAEAPKTKMRKHKVAEELPREETDEDCHDTVQGESCYENVIWAMHLGIHQHPGWYPGLTPESSFQDFQTHLHSKGKGHCHKPCRLSTWRDVKAWSSVAKHASAKAMPRGRVLCNREVPVPRANATGPVFDVSEEDNAKCFKSVAQLLNQGRGQLEKHGRNWCWVGLKEFGCHRHVMEHLSWQFEQGMAANYHATIRQPFHPLRNAETCDQRDLGAARSWSAEELIAARAWFRKNTAVYVLSLPSSTQRRSTVSQRLYDLDMPFTFVAGVDLRQPNALELAREEGLIPKSFNISRAQEEANRPRNGMAADGSIAGTVGCAAGHFRVQRHAVKLTPDRPLTVVFEDDVSPADDFVPRLWSLVTEELPCDWQAVSLASRCPFGTCISPHLTRVQPDINEPAWLCRAGVNWGFQGMLYRTREIESLHRKWKPAVFNEEHPHCLDVDVALASISDQVSFYAVPMVQSPGMLTELHEGSSRASINTESSHAR